MKKAVIKHENGLHTRVAAMVVQKANALQLKHQTSLFIHYKGYKKIPANSLLPLISLQIKSGDEVWVSANDETLDFVEKEMVEFLESDFEAKDVQTINQVDNLLHNSSITAEQVFNNIANGLVAIDENDFITIFNPVAEKILGISSKEAIGKKVYDVIPNSRLQIVNKTGASELGCRQIIGNSVIITDRTPIYVHGQIKGAVAIFQDISKLEKITGELQSVRELKERLHLILETVQDGICVLDKDGYITYVNPAYLRIVGQSPQQLVGKNIKDISSHGARNRVLQSGRQIIGSISKKSNDTTIVANVSPIYVDGEITGCVSVIKDITEIQNLIENLNKATAKAEYLEQELKRTKKPNPVFKNIIGRSGKIIDALAIAEKAAESLATVLIRGESGTGKELVAEGIHYLSPRAEGPFIRVNCAAIPENLLESELFGHEKGAFTGAFKKRLGKFELAHKGTIFLDEIGEMDKNMQAKLLRVLQKKEFERVGGEETIEVDVRIIAATNKILEEMVAKGAFREDLYYRLNVIPIFLVPLRERKEDIPLLVEHFLQKISRETGKKVRGIRSDALEVLMNYKWPGNVRELENILERITVLMDKHYIEIQDLPLFMRQEVVSTKEKDTDYFSGEVILPWEEYEKQIIELALKKYSSYNAAAKALGLTHKTIAAKARKYGIENLKSIIFT